MQRVVRPSVSFSRQVQRRWMTTQVPKYHFISSPKTVSIIGVPLSHGQPRYGVERGPQAIRANGLHRRLENDGWRVDDLGDLSFPQIETNEEETKSNAKYAKMVGTANKILHDAVLAETKKGKFVVNLGGDHSLGIGSIAGILSARPETAVIWVDAHADFNTPKTSLSGNIHGMSAAFLMNVHNSKKTKGFEWMLKVPDLPAQRLAYVGLRDLDPSEKDLIRQMGIKAFTMQDVDRHGIGLVMERAIQHVCARVDRPLHLTLDIDSVDPAFAPSTGTRVRGGLSYREAYFIAESLAETGLLTSMDMVEVNPSISVSEDEQKATVDMAVGLVASALGNRIL